MTISELLQYCMAKPGAEQSVHSDWKATQIKVSDVLFAMVKEVEDQRPAVALKASPELAELLRQQHRDVRPSQHLNKAHWSTVYLDGSLPDSQIYYLVDASYQQAVKMLPEPVRQHLLARRVGGQTVEHRGTGTVAGCGGVEVPWVLGQSCIAGALRAQLGDDLVNGRRSE